MATVTFGAPHPSAGGWWAAVGRRAVGDRQAAVLSPFMEGEEDKPLMGETVRMACADGTAGPLAAGMGGSR